MMVVMVNHDGNFNHQSGWWLLLTPLKNHGGSESPNIYIYTYAFLVFGFCLKQHLFWSLL